MPNYRNPFASSNPQGGAVSSGGANHRLALDNLIRRELKVGDPSDPMQIATALLERYKGDPRARAISQEAQGLPFLTAAPAAAVVVQPTSTGAEQQQAIDDVNRDLQELTTNALLKDVIPELQGWAQSVRSAAEQGLSAARFALDQRQRDKAFAIRRQLGDYARLARFVGALTPAMTMNYRRFAQSLDEVSAVILVSMGESLANVGFAGGRFLLQAPYSELQVRRDSAIYALRNLIGGAQEAYGPNDWPRGLDAYRNLYRSLEEQGHGDLRSLLVETELARIMDELIQRAAQGTADGLRALGSTAQLDLMRFRRIVAIGMNLISPESPPLTAFLESLQLFADAFDSAGGFRLLRISRPPILFYGLYGIGGLDDADRRLQELLVQRGLLADQLDCYMACECREERVICQIALDKILYDVDRAIDLYAVGQEDFGLPERRAAAYGFLIQEFLTTFKVETSFQVQQSGNLPTALNSTDPKKPAILNRIQSALRPALSSNETLKQLVEDLKQFGSAVLRRLDRSEAETREEPNLHTMLSEALKTLNEDQGLDSMVLAYARAQTGQQRLAAEDPDEPTPAPSTLLSSYLDVLEQELCIQLDAEKRWHEMVQTMVPSCVPSQTVFNSLEHLIRSAIARVSGVRSETEFRPRIPPHFETSLDSLADDVDRRGGGRPS